jgi:hypothetical protein
MTFISIVVGTTAIVVLVISLFVVNVVQKKSLSDLNKDISTYSKQLKSTKDLSRILTVQNQLNTLTSLHDGKPVTSRLFDYISQITPAQANLNKLTVDFTENRMSIGGTAPSLDVVSLYTDTLKATYYTTDESTTQTSAFSNVVLANFGRDDKGATFTITLNFDPVIFRATDTVKLVVPSTASADQTNVFQAGN